MQPYQAIQPDEAVLVQNGLSSVKDPCDIKGGALCGLANWALTYCHKELQHRYCKDPRSIIASNIA